MQISTGKFIPDSAPLKPSFFLGVWIIRLTSKVIPYLNTWGFPPLYAKNRLPEKLTKQTPVFFGCTASGLHNLPFHSTLEPLLFLDGILRQ